MPPYCKLLRLGTPAGINGRRRNLWSTWHRSVQYVQDRRPRCIQLNENDRGIVVHVSLKLQMTQCLNRFHIFLSTLLAGVRASDR